MSVPVMQPLCIRLTPVRVCDGAGARDCGGGSQVVCSFNCSKSPLHKVFYSFWQAVAFSANAGISRLKRSEGSAEPLIPQLIRAQLMQCCVQYSGLA